MTPRDAREKSHHTVWWLGRVWVGVCSLWSRALLIRKRAISPVRGMLHAAACHARTKARPKQCLRPRLHQQGDSGSRERGIERESGHLGKDKLVVPSKFDIRQKEEKKTGKGMASSPRTSTLPPVTRPHTLQKTKGKKNTPPAKASIVSPHETTYKSSMHFCRPHLL